MRCVVTVVGWLVLLASRAVLASDYEETLGDLTNDFAVIVEGGDDIADLVASTHGFKVVKRLSNVANNLYHFSHDKVASRSKRHADNFVQGLLKDPNVLLVEQQSVLRREKREIIHDKQVELPIHTYDDKSIFKRFFDRKLVNRDNIPGSGINFNDKYFKYQWYLINTGQTGGPVGFDLNVAPAWEHGFTGRGVVLSILDDGVAHDHPDLKDNYDPLASADLNDKNDNDPMPDKTKPDNGHGTRCAGEIAAIHNNGICGVGISYEAKFGGVRMLDGKVTDLLEADAVTMNNQHVDIYSASWGPTDSGEAMEGPGRFTQQALENGTRQGRGGKGSIFVWATGNGGMKKDDCSADGYVSSIFSLSVGCISDRGLSTYFNEICPSTMAVVFTGGSHLPPTDSDYINPTLKVVTTTLEGCTLSFEGTSSAAPLAAGCFALALQANGELTWRDMQNLVVETARIPSYEEDRGWVKNGAGYHVNSRFGFGVLDCNRMVVAAQRWTTVSEQHVCTVAGDIKQGHISPLSDLVKTLTISGCSADSEHISRLEHVQLHLKLSTGRRGTISITLTSPFNMRTQILKERPNDRSSEGIDFTFMTVHNWGEAPHGEWTLTVHNGDEAHTAVLHAWSLTLYGTAGATNPNRALGLDIAATLGHGAVERGTAGPSHLRAADLRQLMHAEREISSSLDTMSPGEALGTSKRTNDVGRDEAKPQLLNLLSHMLAADQGKLRKRGYVEGAQAEGTQHHAHKTSSALSLLKRLLLAIKRERMRA